MRRLTGIAAVLFALSTVVIAQAGVRGTGPSQEPAAGQAPTQKPPENLKVLPPTTNLRSEMMKISEALGVKCGFCHVQGNYPSDEYSQKRTARRMMQMVKTINETNFPNQKPKEGDSPLGSAVTCYTQPGP